MVQSPVPPIGPSLGAAIPGFGTDGIRGEVGKHPITVDFVLKLGWAAGKVLAQGKRGTVLIGSRNGALVQLDLASLRLCRRGDLGDMALNLDQTWSST